MADSTCSVEGCMKTAARRGWCPMHYQRWRQHGDLTRSRASLPKPPPRICSVEECQDAHAAQGFCNKHYLRWKRFGDPYKVTEPARGEESPNWVTDVCYSTAHARVYRARGKAGHCSYEDCATGSTSYHWANLTGRYADVTDYVQMCAAHHFRYDRERRRTSMSAENYSAPGRRFA